jgi:hypothetical protein
MHQSTVERNCVLSMMITCMYPILLMCIFVSSASSTPYVLFFIPALTPFANAATSTQRYYKTNAKTNLGSCRPLALWFHFFLHKGSIRISLQFQNLEKRTGFDIVYRQKITQLLVGIGTGSLEIVQFGIGFLCQRV